MDDLRLDDDGGEWEGEPLPWIACLALALAMLLVVMALVALFGRT